MTRSNTHNATTTTATTTAPNTPSNLHASPNPNVPQSPLTGEGVNNASGVISAHPTTQSGSLAIPRSASSHVTAAQMSARMHVACVGYQEFRAVGKNGRYNDLPKQCIVDVSAPIGQVRIFLFAFVFVLFEICLCVFHTFCNLCN
jgi:hypothetical protein